MEKAVYITNAKFLRYVSNGYQRMYFGGEFCERLIPSAGELRRAVSFAREKGLAFTLVTPYVTNDGIKKLASLFAELMRRAPQSEVVVNDWGALSLIRRDFPGLVPVLGRLLTKQKRCPTLIKLLKRKIEATLSPPGVLETRRIIIQKKLPPDLDMYYKGSNVSTVPAIHRFLIRQGVKRIELDNLGQGMAVRLPKGKFSASVYVPYVYISTTFFCPSAGCDEEKESILKIRPCSRQCQKYVFVLKHESFPRPIYLKGNTQFYKNDAVSVRMLRGMGVDRIVFSPRIPV